MLCIYYFTYETKETIGQPNIKPGSRFSSLRFKTLRKIRSMLDLAKSTDVETMSEWKTPRYVSFTRNI